MIIFIITIHLYCSQPPKEKTIEVLKDPTLRDRILWRDNGFGAWLFVVILFFVSWFGHGQCFWYIITVNIPAAFGRTDLTMSQGRKVKPRGLGGGAR